MKSPGNLKQLQCLKGRIAALNRFVSRSTDKCLPFFKVLRTKGKFEWTEECEEACSQLNQYLGTAPLLSKSELRDQLYVT